MVWQHQRSTNIDYFVLFLQHLEQLMVLMHQRSNKIDSLVFVFTKHGQIQGCAASDIKKHTL